MLARARDPTTPGGADSAGSGVRMSHFDTHTRQNIHFDIDIAAAWRAIQYRNIAPLSVFWPGTLVVWWCACVVRSRVRVQ